MEIFLAPHNDDEALFGAFTLLRRRPLVVVVTDSWVQFNRGDDITAAERRLESVDAMQVLGCPLFLPGLRDDCLDDDSVLDLLSRFHGVTRCYAPAIQGGHPHHDLIGSVAMRVFPVCTHYSTYSTASLCPRGSVEVRPTHDERALKRRALMCYRSQHNICREHFEAAVDTSEWYV